LYLHVDFPRIVTQETALMIHHNIFMFRNYFAGASLTVMPIYHGKLNSKH